MHKSIVLWERNIDPMNMKEKRFLRIHLITLVTVLVLFLLLMFISRAIMSNEFTDTLYVWSFQQEYNDLEPEQLSLTFDKEGIVALRELKKENGEFVYTLIPEHPGRTGMTITNTSTGEELGYSIYDVTKTGLIISQQTGNFTNYRMFKTGLMFLFLFLTVLLWFSFAYVQKELRFSYHAVFYSGLAIWMTLITILQLRVWLMDDNMYSIYSVIQSAAGVFMLLTLPLMVIFCTALIISNISLIRHEGFRTRNVLGIILSCIMLSGEAVFFFLDALFNSGSDLQLRLYQAGTGIFNSIYAFLECFVIGSIICGTLAAKHEPKYDKDYLIILGCKIKPDGTLYPLIRSRVDRAISFYNRQYQKTGKKAVFIPSGGKGSDETISEADAMKRYLLEQGIPEEQILVENQSRNTVQNMRYSKKLIEERTPDAKVAFSTTNFHVFRSGIISRQNQFEVDGMGSPTKWYFWPNAYMREVVGMMSYKWKSLVLILIPIILFFIAVQFVG